MYQRLGRAGKDLKGKGESQGQGMDKGRHNLSLCQVVAILGTA